jgi:hypothetical protein
LKVKGHSGLICENLRDLRGTKKRKFEIHF